MSNLQEIVDNFIATHAMRTTPEARYIDLVSEVGELGKEILKGNAYGKAALTITDAARDELGDCLFSLLALGSALGIDAEAALYAALNKYARRLAEKGGAGSGV